MASRLGMEQLQAWAEWLEPRSQFLTTLVKSSAEPEPGTFVDDKTSSMLSGGST